MMNMTSTYNSSFSAGGIQVSKHPRAHSNAFTGFADGFRQSLEDWKHTAPEAQVKTLADTGRAIQYFSKSDASLTTYGDKFPRYSSADMKDARFNLPDKDRAVSNVPIGNLGSVSESEKTAKEARDQLYEAQIQVARNREKAILNGTLTNLDQRTQMVGSFSGIIEPGKAPELGVDQGVPAPSREWKALSRASYNPEVHNEFEMARHDVSRLKQGEYARKDKSRRDIFARTIADPGRTAKNDPVFCVSNPKDSTGKQITRFTYCKWAGFVP
jgi:hypothetical protein